MAQADVRAAGVATDSGGVASMRRPPSSRSESSSRRREAGALRGPQVPFMTGSIPQPGASRDRVCIPGYTGHVQGKVAENLHGGTFRAENQQAAQALPLRHSLRRVASEPQSLATAAVSTLSGTRGFSTAPRVPGYSGAVPGKDSETVHGMRFAEASEVAGTLRQHNPHASCDGWMRRGQWPSDPMPSYNWTNRHCSSAGFPLFTVAQEQEAFDVSRKLGRTFGFKPSRHCKYQPGDRFLHSLYKKRHS
mmetsp:Transcript_113572/g.331844  ORF Transcript_113572/g.331844 Transcript_113572/m.331844 type:complete len:249 (-) Transcript_113572:58-804(-)